jgi:hypothetical protein
MSPISQFRITRTIVEQFIALIQVQEGTLAFYVNHSFVDRWSGPGFTTGAKRSVGLNIKEGILSDMAEKYGLCEGIP